MLLTNKQKWESLIGEPDLHTDSTFQHSTFQPLKTFLYTNRDLFLSDKTLSVTTEQKDQIIELITTHIKARQDKSNSLTDSDRDTLTNVDRDTLTKISSTNTILDCLQSIFKESIRLNSDQYEELSQIFNIAQYTSTQSNLLLEPTSSQLEMSSASTTPLLTRETPPLPIHTKSQLQIFTALREIFTANHNNEDGFIKTVTKYHETLSPNLDQVNDDAKNLYKAFTNLSDKGLIGGITTDKTLTANLNQKWHDDLGGVWGVIKNFIKNIGKKAANKTKSTRENTRFVKDYLDRKEKALDQNISPNHP